MVPSCRQCRLRSEWADAQSYPTCTGCFVGSVMQWFIYLYTIAAKRVYVTCTITITMLQYIQDLIRTQGSIHWETSFVDKMANIRKFLINYRLSVYKLQNVFQKCKHGRP